MRYFVVSLVLAVVGAVFFLVLGVSRNIDLNNPAGALSGVFDFEAKQPNPLTNAPAPANPNSDIENQKPLANPPGEIKGVYATSWSAGSNRKIDELINFIKKNNLNAIVIDIKDFSGYVAYDIKNPEVKKYGAKEVRIPKINSLLKKLHNENIYVIARITIFQDPILAKARPDLAIHSKSNCQMSGAKCHELVSTLWLDHKKLAWIDPASKEAWDYNISIAKDASERGFDELNFDYIRFASDGNLDDMSFPIWDGKTPKNAVIKEFFKYLREQLADRKISADIFGLVTVNYNDMGIGQVLEDIFPYFDYISPMVYPSHYTKGFLGYKNPAAYPYEVIKYSMESAIKRIKIYDLRFKNASSTGETTSTEESLKSYGLNLKSKIKLRPWLQDFDLGADYNAKMIIKQIQAVYDAASSTPEVINGFLLWDPKNIYTAGF